MRLFLFFLFLLINAISFAQVPAYVPQYGLRCYYPFNGNPNDVSSAASHLTNSGAVLTTDRFNNANSAYSFNGTNQSMFNNTPNFTFTSTSSFTISVWILRPSTAGGVALINGTSAAGNFIWLLQGGATGMSYGTNKQQQSWIYAASPFTLNIWEHFVCVYNNGAMTFYRNNTIESTATFTYTGVTSANLPLYVGKGISGGFFNGKIDDIGIWDRALTSCEISDLYNSSSTLLTVNAGADTTICSGQNVTLNGSGANTYVWNQGVTNGVSFAPTSTQTYTLTGINTVGCSAWDQVNVNVGTSSINAGPDQLACLGSPVTLTGSGGTGYSWDNGVQNGTPFIPTSSATYTLTATDPLGCTGTDQVVVTLYQPPINAGQNITICAQTSVTLSGSGGSTYVWDNGVTNGSPFVPNASGTFTVIGTDTAGCSKSDSLYITVKPLSNIQAGADLSICLGQSITLSASGGLYYIWNNGVFNNSPFTPTTTTTYIVSGADSSNCVNSDTVTITVNQASSSTLTINAIDQYDLNGTIYSNSGTYTQVIPNANGCDSTITLILTLAYTGLSENEADILSLYPNPTSNLLHISVNSLLTGKFLLMFGEDGREVLRIKLVVGDNVVDVSNLALGVYTCRMQDRSGRVFRWVKN